MKIQVECHSGYKSNERPIKFWIDEEVFFMESIEDQWRGTDAMFFRVRADDSRTYVLSYNETYVLSYNERTGLWTLGK